MKKYRTRRDLLHKSKLAEFVAWTLDNGYVQHPKPPKSIYEVARLELYDEAGNNPHIVIYERLTGDHLTVDADGVRLVHRWLSSKIRSVA